MESQRIVSTRPLVDTDDEQRLLEELIDGAKPQLRDGEQAKRLHYLLYSPFRYPPLRHGSRFGRRVEPSLWYGSEELKTALAETAYYRIRFFEGTTAKLAPLSSPMSAFQAHVQATATVDVSDAPFRPYVRRICSPTTYSTSQPLGSEMRRDGVEVVRFPSARDPDRGANVGLFTPSVFASNDPLQTPETWHCTVTAAHDVEFHHERVSRIDTLGFTRRDFLARGVLPIPAA